MDDKKCKNIHGLRNRRHIIHTSVMREVDKKRKEPHTANT